MNSDQPNLPSTGAPTDPSTPATPIYYSDVVMGYPLLSNFLKDTFASTSATSMTARMSGPLRLASLLAYFPSTAITHFRDLASASDIGSTHTDLDKNRFEIFKKIFLILSPGALAFHFTYREPEDCHMSPYNEILEEDDDDYDEDNREMKVLWLVNERHPTSGNFDAIRAAAALSRVDAQSQKAFLSVFNCSVRTGLGPLRFPASTTIHIVDFPRTIQKYRLDTMPGKIREAMKNVPHISLPITDIWPCPENLAEYKDKDLGSERARDCLVVMDDSKHLTFEVAAKYAQDRANGHDIGYLMVSDYARIGTVHRGFINRYGTAPTITVD